MSRNLDNPKAASDFADEFDRQAEPVRENPELHALSRVPEAAAKGCRAFFVKRYLVLYKIDGNRVVIARAVIAHLFHQTQNYAKFFDPEH